MWEREILFSNKSCQKAMATHEFLRRCIWECHRSESGRKPPSPCTSPPPHIGLEIGRGLLPVSLLLPHCGLSPQCCLPGPSIHMTKPVKESRSASCEYCHLDELFLLSIAAQSSTIAGTLPCWAFTLNSESRTCRWSICSSATHDRSSEFSCGKLEFSQRTARAG